MNSEIESTIDKSQNKSKSKRGKSCCSTDWVRALVSTNKNRTKFDKYDLDLTYITNRIIAMGFPAEGFEGMYRNRKQDIIEFLKEHHGKMVKIYNLCAEQKYAYP